MNPIDLIARELVTIHSEINGIVEINGNSNENGNANADTSIECFADNVKFTCVWQQPEVNMHIINQIMNQINIFNDNDYGDCTPSNITALISSSFPSSVTLEGFNDGDNVECDEKKEDMEMASTFVASTPISTIKMSDEARSINENSANDDKQQLLNAFNDTSPILFQSRQRSLYTRKKLHMG